MEWTLRCPDSKEGRVSLQWLKCRLIFHLTRWRDVWIPYGDPRESHSSQLLLDRGPHIHLRLREVRWVHAATRENSWDFPLATRWGPIPMLCMQRNCVFPIKHIRSFDLLHWTLESPQQDCHKTRRTLMSNQERKIDWCTPNQLKMKHISPSLNP